MKKTLLSIVAVLAVNSASLSAASLQERMDFCNKLTSVSPSMVKVAEDAYSLEHHTSVTTCVERDPKEWQDMLSQSPLVAFLGAVSFRPLSPDYNPRISKVCGELLYEILVADAHKNNVDTVEGLKDAAIRFSTEKLDLIQMCNNVARNKISEKLSDAVKTGIVSGLSDSNNTAVQKVASYYQGKDDAKDSK